MWDWYCAMVFVRVYPKVRLCITLVDPQIDEHRYFLGYPKDSRTLKLFVRFITRSITVDPLHFKCLHCGVLGRVDVVSCVVTSRHEISKLIFFLMHRIWDIIQQIFISHLSMIVLFLRYLHTNISLSSLLVSGHSSCFH